MPTRALCVSVGATAVEGVVAVDAAPSLAGCVKRTASAPAGMPSDSNTNTAIAARDGR